MIAQYLRCAVVIALFLVLFPSVGMAVAAPAAEGVDPAAVDRYMSEYLSKTRLPGASIAITHGDRVVYVAGYGHDSSGAAITATTRMPIASVSKSMTALAVTHGYIRAYGFAIPVAEPDWFVGASHGVITTATDLAAWLITQNNGGVAPDGHRVVSAAAVTEMHTPA